MAREDLTAMAAPPQTRTCPDCGRKVIEARGAQGEAIYLDTTAQVWIQVPAPGSAVPAAYAPALALGFSAHVQHGFVCPGRRKPR